MPPSMSNDNDAGGHVFSPTRTSPTCARLSVRVASLSLGIAAALFLARPAREVSAEVRPSVVEVEREGNPPDEVVGEAEDDCGGSPAAAPDELREADGAEDFSREPHGREQPAALGRARDFEIDDAVEPTTQPKDAKIWGGFCKGRARKGEDQL